MDTIRLWFPIGEVAQACGIHVQTVRRWEREGIIPRATRRRGRRLYRAEDISAIRGLVFDAPDHDGERHVARVNASTVSETFGDMHDGECQRSRSTTGSRPD
jgi:hypothetical protein